ncbi:craniofacial development protein 1-like isoform 3-T3 [Salvelinus alpinus]
MNYSDYDSDGYSSNADQDYVPSDDNLSEDDMNECVKEDGLEGDDQRGQQSDNVTKKKKKKGQHIGMRKRKKGGLKLEETLHDGSVEDQKVEQGEEREFSTPRPKKEEDEEKKKKADDLWASFLSDVGHKSKPPTPVPQATTKQQAVPTDSSKKPISAPSEPQQPEPKEPSKVTITKVFDFAGEEVRVSKEVDADSKEAKSFLKAKEETPYVQTVPRGFEPSSLAPGLRTSSWPGSADERMRSSWVHPLQTSGGAPPLSLWLQTSGGAPPLSPWLQTSGGAPPLSLWLQTSGGAPPLSPWLQTSGGAPPLSPWLQTSGGAPPLSPWLQTSGGAPPLSPWLQTSGGAPPLSPWLQTSGGAPPLSPWLQTSGGAPPLSPWLQTSGGAPPLSINTQSKV